MKVKSSQKLRTETYQSKMKQCGAGIGKKDKAKVASSDILPTLTA